MHIYRIAFFVIFQVNVVISQNTSDRRLVHPQEITIPKQILRRQGNRNRHTSFQSNLIEVIPKASIAGPSSLIPNASIARKKHPVFRNKSRRQKKISNGNAIDNFKIGRKRLQKHQRKRSNELRNSMSGKHAKDLRIVRKEIRRRNEIDGPIPIMPPHNSLQHETLPLTFGTLGLLPTGVSIESPQPGSRIQLDRTLDRRNLNNHIQNELTQQANGGLVRRPPENRVLVRSPQENRVLVSSPQERPIGFIDTPPQSVNGHVGISDTMNRNFHRNTDTRRRLQPRNNQHEPLLPRNNQHEPLLPRNNQHEPLLPRNNQHEPLQQFNDFTIPQQRTFTTTFPVRRPQFLRFPGRASVNSRQTMFPARRSVWSGFAPNLPMSLNVLPFLSLSDNFDIDDTFMFSNSFFPRRRRFNFYPQLINQHSFLPEMPFSSFAGNANTFGIQIRGRLNRRMFPTTRSQSVFQTSTPFSAMMTTPPSVQTNSVLPPPSAFFPPVFRDDDFGPFIQQTLYNPYIYDTFLSDFTETSRNNTRTDKTDIVSDRSSTVRPERQEKILPFNKDKAKRIKMSKTLGLNTLYDYNIYSKEQQKIKSRKPIWYRNLKPF